MLSCGVRVSYERISAPSAAAASSASARISSSVRPMAGTPFGCQEVSCQDRQRRGLAGNGLWGQQVLDPVGQQPRAGVGFLGFGDEAHKRQIGRRAAAGQQRFGHRGRGCGVRAGQGIGGRGGAAGKRSARRWGRKLVRLSARASGWGPARAAEQPASAAASAKAPSRGNREARMGSAPFRGNF